MPVTKDKNSPQMTDHDAKVQVSHELLSEAEARIRAKRLELGLDEAGDALPARTPTRRPDDQAKKRVGLVVEFSEALERSMETQERTEALRLARSIALAGLPKKRTKDLSLSRTLRLGRSSWLRVTYSTREGNELPFGEDRFVLAAIQHLALEQERPAVAFERVGQLLEMFGVLETSQNLRTLRKRFKRLAGLSIALTFGTSEEELDEESAGEQVFVIRQWMLPTRKQLKAQADENAQQMLLPLPAPRKSKSSTPFGVVLSDDFWNHLQETDNHLIVPLALLKLFLDRPIGWDYLMFLVARCGRARTETVVDHEVLMGLFKDSPKEPDRNALHRLQQYHKEIMLATKGRLNATLEPIGYFPSTGGRPRKRWGLRVGPSKQIVWSGKTLPFLKSDNG